jgi:protein subunit release factor A
VTRNKEAIMSVIVEIRAGEGGGDAKLLVYEQYAVYKKFEARQCL